MAVDLKNHPGVNPQYFEQMEARQQVFLENFYRKTGLVKRPALPVPNQPNKYMPHIGAKQRAKGAK